MATMKHDKFYYLACAFQRNEKRTKENPYGKVNLAKEDMKQIEDKATALREERSARKLLR